MADDAAQLRSTGSDAPVVGPNVTHHVDTGAQTPEQLMAGALPHAHRQERLKDTTRNTDADQMDDAGYVLRNLETAQEQSFEQLDDALDAVQVPFIETSQHWAIFSSGEQAPDRTPMAVGTGPFAADGSTIIGCRPDATPRISDSR